MTSSARVGFSMHPRWAAGNALRGFLEPLRDAGLAAVEFELDSNDPLWPQFAALMADCRQLGFELCFHAPYRAPHTIAEFSGQARARIQADYRPMLDVVASLGPATMVVHGAKSESRPIDRLTEDTLGFLEWVLHDYPTLTLALENANLQLGVNKVGSTPEDLLTIVERLGDPRLRICWDVGHYVHAGYTSAPTTAWLKRVGHVHIHDLNPAGQDHLPFLYGRVVPGVWLSHLPRSFEGIVTLELNGQRCAFLWPDRIMPALISSIGAIDAIIGSGHRDRHPATPRRGVAHTETGDAA